MHYPVITRKRDLFSYYTPWKGAGHETSSFFIKEEMYESDLSIQCDPVYTLGIIFWGSSFCNNVSVEEVARAVRNGADTVEKVTAATGAGADCDKCKGGVLQSIIKNRG